MYMPTFIDDTMIYYSVVSPTHSTFRKESMTIIASCGHELSDDEGPYGLGFNLAVRSQSREGEPAVQYGVYCTKCRDWAQAEPDYVFETNEAAMDWLNGVPAPD